MLSEAKHLGVREKLVGAQRGFGFRRFPVKREEAELECLSPTIGQLGVALTRGLSAGPGTTEVPDTSQLPEQRGVRGLTVGDLKYVKERRR